MFYACYNTPQADKLAVVKNWLGRKALQYLETLMTTEKETVQHLRRPIMRHRMNTIETSM